LFVVTLKVEGAPYRLTLDFDTLVFSLRWAADISYSVSRVPLNGTSHSTTLLIGF
jgi:hypothetical protein